MESATSSDVISEDAIQALARECADLHQQRAWERLRVRAAQLLRAATAAGTVAVQNLARQYLAGASRAAGDARAAVTAWGMVIETADPARRSLQAVAHGNRANALVDLGLLDEALPDFEQALELESDIEGRRAILSNRANAYVALGELRMAAAQLRERSRELRRAGASGEPLAVALDNEAMAVLRLGQNDLAAALLQEAAEELDADTGIEARVLNALARAEVALADEHRAAAAAAFMQGYELAFEWAETQVDAEHYANAAAAPDSVAAHPGLDGFVAGLAAKEAGQPGPALMVWKQARTVAAEAGDHELALRIDANAGALLSDAGDIQQAEAILRSVIEEAGARGLALPESLAWGTLATLAAEGADLHLPTGVLGALARSAVLLSTQAAIVARAGASAQQAEWQAPDNGQLDNGLGKQARRMFALETARVHFEKAIAVAHRRDASAFALANRLGNLLDTLDLMLETGLGLSPDPDAASSPARVRARADAVAAELAEAAGRDDLPLRGVAVARKVLGEHAARTDRSAAIGHLRLAVEALEGQRQQLPPGEGRSAVTFNMRWTYRLLARFLREKGDNAGAFDALQGVKGRRLIDLLGASAPDGPRDGVPTAVEVRTWLRDGRLPAGTVVVDLAVEEDALVAYLVAADGVSVVTRPGPTRRLSDIERGDVLERQQRVVTLCRQDTQLTGLVQAVDEKLAADASVLIVPDGPLHNLPLHLVPVAGQAWCERRRIGFAATAGAARFFTAHRTAPAAALVAGDSSAAKPLPHAAAECHEIAAMLGTTPLVGPGVCTREAVVAALSTGERDVVHLAVHGRGDARRGGRASLLLGEQDWVGFDQLARLPWRARLVVFSGCSTAVGGLRHQRDFLDVASAAAEAGVSSVIACLWPIGDASARVFMTALYQWWVPRRGVAVDLREGMDHARSALRAWLLTETARGGPRDGRTISTTPITLPAAPVDPTTADTLQWAPFILLGDPVQSAAPGLG